MSDPVYLGRVLLMWPSATDGQTFFIEVDATTSETHGQTNLVTSHPVERGAAISDHIRPNPDTLSITGVISNTPHYLPRDHAGGAQEQPLDVTINIKGTDNRDTVEGVPPTLSQTPLGRGPVGVFGRIPVWTAQQAQVGRVTPNRQIRARALGFSQQFDRVQDVFDELSGLRTSGQLLRVKTSLRTYTDMAITSLEVNRTADTGNVLQFDLELQQVRFGATKVVPVKLPGKRQKGTTTPEEVETSDEADQTILSYLVDR